MPSQRKQNTPATEHPSRSTRATRGKKKPTSAAAERPYCRLLAQNGIQLTRNNDDTDDRSDTVFRTPAGSTSILIADPEGCSDNFPSPTPSTTLTSDRNFLPYPDDSAPSICNVLTAYAIIADGQPGRSSLTAFTGQATSSSAASASIASQPRADRIWVVPRRHFVELLAKLDVSQRMLIKVHVVENDRVSVTDYTIEPVPLDTLWNYVGIISELSEAEKQVSAALNAITTFGQPSDVDPGLVPADRTVFIRRSRLAELQLSLYGTDSEVVFDEAGDPSEVQAKNGFGGTTYYIITDDEMMYDFGGLF